MQRGPLAGQQVLVDRLADERVAEGVRPVGVGDEQLVRDGLARAVVDVAGEHGLQQLVADRPLGHGGHAHHLLGGARQALEAAEQRVAQRGRELAGVGGGGQQLLGVEGVALRPRVQAVGQAGIGLVAEDAGELLDHLAAAEALQRHPLDARGALQLGEDGTQRMAAVELVGAVGGEQEERLGPRVADEEDEEVARGGVGPVEVLDHQRDGAEPVQQREQRLEHLRLARRLGHRLAERPQRLGERRVGEGRAAELQAVADEDWDPPPLGPRLELGYQPALADARLAGHEGEGRHAVQRRLEHGQLIGAPDEGAAGDAAEHDLHCGGRVRGERAHRPAPLGRSRPGIGEEEESRRSPRVNLLRARPKRRWREALSMRSSTNWAAMTRALSVCMAEHDAAETAPAHREVAPT